MAQTAAYALDPASALPGMLADAQYKCVRTFIAATDLPAGVFVVYDTATGKVRLPADTDDAEEIVGVTMYEATLEGGSAIHKANATVPVITKGDVWVSFSGGAATPTTQVRVHCDDAGAPADQGKATASAAVADVILTPGVALVSAKFGFRDATASMACVSLNF